MTISDATRALALRARRGRTPDLGFATLGDAPNLVELMARSEATWVEAVAVVQAVCAQLSPGKAMPAIDDIRLSMQGDVSFSPAGPADDLSAVRDAGQLLRSILRNGDCPMLVWELTERARRAPASIGSAPAFGAALTCLPIDQGVRELAQYVRVARSMAPSTGRFSTASFASRA